MAEKSKKKKSGRQNYDWAAIKLEYVTDPNMTLRKIADKYGIARATVYKKSKADDWFATRNKTQAKVIAKAIAKTENKQASELAKEMEFLSLMKGHVASALNDQKQFRRHIKVDPVTGAIGEQILEKIDTKALKDIMQVAKMMEDMTRSLYNLQKAETLQRYQIERERLEIGKERLQLERERNALRSQNNGADENYYGVVIMPEVLADGE